MIDKSWVDKSIESNEFKNGVVQFLDFAFTNAAVKGRILCPCIQCNFRSLGNRAEVSNHLLQKGFPSKYASWYMHGEKPVQASVKSELQLNRPRCQWKAILSTSPKKDGKYMNEEKDITIHPIMIDKTWIDKPVESNEFKNGVVQFLDFAFSNAAIKGRILCPCIQCDFRSLGNRAEVSNHLLQKGFPSKYTSWYMHGEKSVQSHVKSELQLKRPRSQWEWEAILSTSPKKNGKYMNGEGKDITDKRSQYLSEDQDHAVSLGVLSKVIAHPDGTIGDVCKVEVSDQVDIGEKFISNLRDLDFWNASFH